jgi:hypothetical protein
LIPTRNVAVPLAGRAAPGQVDLVNVNEVGLGFGWAALPGRLSPDLLLWWRWLLGLWIGVVPWPWLLGLIRVRGLLGDPLWVPLGDWWWGLVGGLEAGIIRLLLVVVWALILLLRIGRSAQLVIIALIEVTLLGVDKALLWVELHLACAVVLLWGLLPLGVIPVGWWRLLLPVGNRLALIRVLIGLMGWWWLGTVSSLSTAVGGILLILLQGIITIRLLGSGHLLLLLLLLQLL